MRPSNLSIIGTFLIRLLQPQFSGSKMEVHVHLKNTFPGGIGNRRITFDYNLWFASYPSPGLPIRDCAGSSNNFAQMCPKLSVVHVTAKAIFERWYLVPGLRPFGPRVNCPYASTTLTVHTTTISQLPCNFFSRMAPHFFDNILLNLANSGGGPILKSKAIEDKAAYLGRR